MMKKPLIFFMIMTIVCLNMFLFSSTVEAATITTYANTPGAVQSSTFTVKAESASIFVESFQSIDYVRFAASGGCSIEITASENITSYTISPSSESVTPAINGTRMTFSCSTLPFQCVIQINSLRKIVILADPLEVNPPQPGNSNVVNVMDFVTDNTGATDQHDNIISAINYVCSTAGKDTLYFPNGTYLTSPLTIDSKSNLKIYLKDGAKILRKLQNPITNANTLRFYNCSNCKLFGRGVIDSNGKAQYALTGRYTLGGSAIAMDYCSYVSLEDIINRDSQVWQCTTHQSNNMTYYNIKNIATPEGAVYSSDGFSIHNSHDCSANYVFAMSNDDNLILSCDNADYPEYNITISHHTGYAWRACGIAMGYNLVSASYVKNVTVQNSNIRMGLDILTDNYQYPVKMECGPSYYENIRFINVKFDNNRSDYDYFTTVAFGTQQGTYDNIYVKGDLEFTNCTVENPGAAHMYGDATNKINNLIVKNLKVGGKIKNSLGEADFTVSNVKAIDFTPHTDEFNSSPLASPWSWVREDSTKWSLTASSGNMRITSDGGDLYQSVNTTKNILVRNVPSGDWAVTTKVTVNPGSNYSQAGLIVYKDDDNYIKLTRCYADGNTLNYAKEVGAIYSDDGFASVSSTTVYLKIIKTGTTYTLYYNTDGGSTWNQVKQYTGVNFGTSFKVGLLSQSTAISADFDWFDVTSTSVPTRVNDNGATVTYTGTWAVSTTDSGFYNSDCHYSNIPISSYVDCTFSGTSIKVIGTYNTNCGYADVYIDGSFIATINTYSPKLLYKQTLFSKTDLSNTNHTIRVYIKSGGYQYLDAFEYIPS